MVTSRGFRSEVGKTNAKMNLNFKSGRGMSQAMLYTHLAG
jgi:hypothetical protein